jgi:hypothetical protein
VPSSQAILLAAVVAAYFARGMLLPSPPLGLGSSDLYHYHYFVAEYVFGAFRRGELPAWNPYQLTGLPTIAALEVGAFYPPNLLHLVLPTWAAMAAVTLFHLLLAAFTTWAFARRAGIGSTAAVAAALVFTLRGTFPNFAISPNLFAAAAWLPLGAIAVLDLAERPAARPMVLLAVAFAASLLGGHPQATLYLGYAWTTLFVAWLAADGSTRRRWPPAALAFGGALLLGAAVAAVQLVPTQELTSLGSRPAAAVEPAQLLPMGGFTVAVKQLLAHPVYGSWLSFGVVALALAAGALAGPRLRALAWWALGVAVVSALFALGPITPVFALYDSLPLAPWFRIPERLMLLTDFAVAILVAVGLDLLTRASAGRPRRSILTATTTVLPVAAVALLASQQAGLAAVAVAFGVAAVLALVLPPHGDRPLLASLLLLGLLVEIAAQPVMPVNFPFGPGRAAHLAVYDAPLSRLRERAGDARIWIVGAPLDPALARKQSTRHRVRGVDDYAPLNLRRQGDYFTYFMRAVSRSDDPLGAFMGAVHPIDAAGVPPASSRRRLLDLAAVEYLVADAWIDYDPELQRFLRESGWMPVADPSLEPLRVFRNPTVLPRAFTVHRIGAAPPTDELLRRLAEPTFDPLAMSFVEGLVSRTSPARGAPATFVVDGERAVELEVTLTAPGLVVLADAYYPGWRATVDGRPAPIVPVNHLFRGVGAPEGTHRVRFEYRATRVWWGAAVSAAALVIALLLFRRGAASGFRSGRT